MYLYYQHIWALLVFPRHVVIEEVANHTHHTNAQSWDNNTHKCTIQLFNPRVWRGERGKKKPAKCLFIPLLMTAYKRKQNKMSAAQTSTSLQLLCRISQHSFLHFEQGAKYSRSLTVMRRGCTLGCDYALPFRGLALDWHHEES